MSSKIELYSVPFSVCLMRQIRSALKMSSLAWSHVLWRICCVSSENLRLFGIRFWTRANPFSTPPRSTGIYQGVKIWDFKLMRSLFSTFFFNLLQSSRYEILNPLQVSSVYGILELHLQEAVFSRFWSHCGRQNRWLRSILVSFGSFEYLKIYCKDMARCLIFREPFLAPFSVAILNSVSRSFLCTTTIAQEWRGMEKLVFF